MTGLNPYLNFAGTCRDAMSFYRDCLGGELSIQTFAEAQQEVPDDYKNQVMHAELRMGSVLLMASDCPPEYSVTMGSNVILNIGLSDVQEQETIFNKLSKGGVVTMELQDAFWGARFGMLTDRFGVHWMLNCDL